ncbi:MAG: hypothetical protein NVSMB4_12220 [Acidimicrobiales bacterium]
MAGGLPDRASPVRVVERLVARPDEHRGVGVGTRDPATPEVLGEQLEELGGSGHRSVRVPLGPGEDHPAVQAPGALDRDGDRSGQEVDVLDSEPGTFTPSEAEDRRDVDHRRATRWHQPDEAMELGGGRKAMVDGAFLGEVDLATWGAPDPVRVHRQVEHGTQHRILTPGTGTGVAYMCVITPGSRRRPDLRRLTGPVADGDERECDPGP